MSPGLSEVAIVDAVRSPIGKGRPSGALATLHPVELLGQVVSALLVRAPIEPELVDDFLVGCVSQVGEQSASIGRQAWLAAGLPEAVPSSTIDRRCGSGQQAIQFAAMGIMAGVYDVVVAGGVESMSRVPILSNRLDADPFGPSVTARYAPGPVSQGIAAELLAADWGLERDALDAYACRSHRRAAAAAAAGLFAREITPIEVPSAEGGSTRVTVDETIRPDTTTERLADLQPAFTSDQEALRFPQIRWSITAGSSSQIADGAAALLLMSHERAKALGVVPRAFIRGQVVLGDDPIRMLTAPIPATRQLLERHGLSTEAIDHYEVNEAFASVPLAWLAELGVNEDRLNPLGGAIALGHPLGASGARIATTMLTGLEEAGGRYGLQVMCEAGGLANAMLIERNEER
jgi:acetyl-CoA acyltransferase